MLSLRAISAEMTYRILLFWGYKTLVKVTVKKNTKFHGHRIISFENIEILIFFINMYVEYQKNHIKLDFNSTLKCFSTTDFWWMYLT